MSHDTAVRRESERLAAAVPPRSGGPIDGSGQHPRRLSVRWAPGSDVLTGQCWCGTAQEQTGPAEVWDWLLSHLRLHHGSAE